ncbi:hypothetical protein XENOCAPTIV_011790 [Xenoophorus captivus]|uniref:Uncharacterized protein n=1 Tax=Xenoophorus captivus TaxID=1517983 RepID=A0ABV0Q9G2_9TELE
MARMACTLCFSSSSSSPLLLHASPPSVRLTVPLFLSFSSSSSSPPPSIPPSLLPLSLVFYSAVALFKLTHTFFLMKNSNISSLISSPCSPSPAAQGTVVSQCEKRRERDQLMQSLSEPPSPSTTL